MQNSLKLCSGGRAIWAYAMRRLSGVALLLALGGWTGLSISSSAQTTLNITDYGAKGDAVQFFVNTVSNSVVVTTTNTFSAADIGKTIEVFGVGKMTYGRNSYGVTTNGWQDVIAIVTNVVNATNLYLNVLPQDGATNYIPSRTMTVWATMGTDNLRAFSNCIAAAPTNAIIYIPAGTYLVMPVHANGGGYRFGAIILKRGGLHFRGDDRNNTVLLSRGAWQSYSGIKDGVYPYRSFLFEVVAPVTNDYPIVLENLTLDGGVQQGNLNVHGISINCVDGLGWDEQHSAYLTFDTKNAGGTASMQIFTNVNVVHWRGESLKSIDGNTNGTIDIQNCFFGDICATALNIYPRWNVRSNIFSNCWQVTEYYQKFYRGTAYFCNNLITNPPELVANGSNYIGNAVSINGGIWTASPLVIQSNRLVNPSGRGMNVFITTPAANVSFLDNKIYATPYSQIFNLNAPGAQGTHCNSNILIMNNYVYCTNQLGSVFNFGSASGTDCLDMIYDLTICSNKVECYGGIQHFTWASAWMERVKFFHNTATNSVAVYQTGSKRTNGSSFVYIETNNLSSPPLWDLYSVSTNIVSYKDGPKRKVNMVTTGGRFILEDSCSNQIPAKAYIEIDNTHNRWPKNGWGGGDMSGNVIVYPSQKSGTAPMTLPNGSLLTFYWTGSEWSTNQNWSKPRPPGNLRVGK